MSERRRIRALIIDDDPTIRMLAKMALEDVDEVDYDVDTAGTVAQGMAMAEVAEPPYAVVVSDNRINGETAAGIAASARGLRERQLSAGLVGFTSDAIPPTEEQIFGPNGPDRPYVLVNKGGSINLADFIGGVASVTVLPDAQ